MNNNAAQTSRIIIAFIVVTITAFAGHCTLAQAQDAPPPPRRHGDRSAPTTRPQAARAPATRPLSPLAHGERRLALHIEGGHDTDRRDHGRPVTLIAAALKVPENVFRETFTHVHPAGPGSGGPTDTEARQNKGALMAGLSPYGVTDDRLNAVSNYYRYMKRDRDDLWQHRDAVAYAVVQTNNKVVRFDLVDAGAGYTTPPTITIQDLPDLTVTAKLEFGTDFATNGSIKSLTIAQPTTAPAR